MSRFDKGIDTALPKLNRVASVSKVNISELEDSSSDLNSKSMSGKTAGMGFISGNNLYVATGSNSKDPWAVFSSNLSEAPVNEYQDDILNYYVSAGQSLSVGYTDNSNTPINSEALKDVYLYSGVPAISVNGAVAPEDTSSVVDFSQPFRETHIHSMLSYVMERVGGSWLVAPQGRAGKSIYELTKGTEPFSNGLVMKDGASSVASDMGKSIEFPFFTYIQGESDVLTSKEAYTDEVYSYYQHMIDSHSELGSSGAEMFTAQVGTGGSNSIASAELDISNTHPFITLAAPIWPLSRVHPSTTSDKTHLNEKGYVELGNLLGRAILEKVYRGVDFKPLQPVATTVIGNTVNLEFHVPKGTLVIDKETFPEAPSLGIGYYYQGGIAVTNSTYSLSGNKLSLSFDTSFPLLAGGTIRAGGTLQDHSSTDGINVPLINLRGSEVAVGSSYDWCCQFDIELTKEMGALDPETDNLWSFGSEYISTEDSFVTVLGLASASYLDGSTYQVDYDSATIESGSVRIFVGDDAHTVSAGGGSYIATRGNTTRLRLQSGNGGFVGQVRGLTIRKLT